MLEQFSRTELLIGKEAIEKLKGFEPVLYKKKESNIIKIIEEYIENN